MATSQPRSKRFNMTGALSDLRLRTDSRGRPVLTARLDRQGKPRLAVVAFADKADYLRAQFAEGERVSLFGFFKKAEQVDRETGEITASQEFVVLRADEPRAGGRPKRLSEDAAYARLQQAQSIYAVDPCSPAAQRALASAWRDLDRATAA